MNDQNQLTAAIVESLRTPEPPSGAGLLHGNLSRAIVGAAIEVHKHLGPGQLECTYQHALERELAFRGIAHQAQVPTKSFYKGAQVGTFVVDLIVEDAIVVVSAHDRSSARPLDQLRRPGAVPGREASGAVMS